MLSIIDKMIDQTDCTISETSSHESLDMNMIDAGDTNFNSQPNIVDLSGANSLPLRIQGNFTLAIDDSIPSSSDHSIPNRSRGFLFQESGNFEFIGPDKDTVNIEMVEQCINIADIVRGINKPNYQQVRFPSS